MEGLRTLLSRLAALFRRGTLDRELDEELQSHLQFAIEENRRHGMSEKDARAAALRAFGSVTQVREHLRLHEGFPLLEDQRRDAGYALRQMRKSPGFAATAIGTLALGIGAAAAMFTVVDHVLLQPTSYRDPGQLVSIREIDHTGNPAWPLPWLDIEQWIKQSHSFQQIAFYTDGGGRSYLEGKTSSLQVETVKVSANMLPMLGVPPAFGRTFLPETPGSAPGRNAGSLVLSHAAWMDLFDGDRSIPGKVVRIDGMPYTVAGIMPPGFRYPVGSSVTPQVWMPIQLGKDDHARSRDAESYSVVARMKPGVTIARANAEIDVIQKQLSSQYPNAQERQDHSAVAMERYSSTLVDADTRKALLALLTASGVLWLIAGMNVTNLLLARGTARQREMAMRRALGASRGRVVRQMLIEGLVLSAIAGVLGIALALSSVKLLAHGLSQHLPVPAPATPDVRIVVGLLGMTVLSALMSAAWPALLAVRIPIEPALKQGSQQTGASRRHHRLRATLVAAEIAMSLTLLVGCGLLLRSIYALRHVPLGYRTDHIVVASLNIPAFRFAGRNMTTDLYQPLLDRVQHLHGVQSGGLMTEVPLANTFAVMLDLRINGNNTNTWLKAATPDAQKVFGFRMAAGRFFDARDTPSSEPVAVVNEAFARAYSPDLHNPAAILGRKLMSTDQHAKKGESTEIVGVLADTHQFQIALPSQPELEICIPQITPDNTFYDALDGMAMDLAIRTEQPTDAIIPEIRDILRHASPELANATITTMDQIVEDSYGSQRLAAQLLEIFGGSALLLCVAGLYGLLAYVVAQRTRELALRIALGAGRSNLLWLVLRQAAAMLLAGVVVGIPMAWASGRLVRGFLYGVSIHDGWTLAGAALLLLASGLLAAYLPARRASGVDPMQALRSE